MQQLQEALGEYGCAFWARLRPAQLARAVVATPYPLCAVSVGIHISAPHAVAQEHLGRRCAVSRCVCRMVKSHRRDIEAFLPVSTICVRCTLAVSGLALPALVRMNTAQHGVHAAQSH